MTSIKQKTLSCGHEFQGKGLHTGQIANMRLLPASVGTGIVFHRVDLGCSTARSTTISQGAASVSTIEHLMSALSGMGVDNALIEIDNVEVPILDGSARFYVEALIEDGLVEQDAEKRYITLPREIEVRDEKTGSYIKVTPSDVPSSISTSANSRSVV